MKEMVGGCCVCSDDRGWPENPLVYCDGTICSVAVHQACYGIVTVPTGPWYCRKCESQERAVKVRCELCPSKYGALKRTDTNAWAHVVCALYIPEVRFGNVTTMEPIQIQMIPPERFNKTCYICEENGKASSAAIGACMQCNKSGCKQQFHVTCAQGLGLLCEEAGNYLDNVKYCGYCQHHYSKLKKGGNVKTIPPFKPQLQDNHNSDSSSEKELEAVITRSSTQLNNTSKRKSSSRTSNSTSKSSSSSKSSHQKTVHNSSNKGGSEKSKSNSVSGKSTKIEDTSASVDSSEKTDRKDKDIEDAIKEIKETKGKKRKASSRTPTPISLVSSVESITVVSSIPNVETSTIVSPSSDKRDSVSECGDKVKKAKIDSNNHQIATITSVSVTISNTPSPVISEVVVPTPSNTTSVATASIIQSTSTQPLNSLIVSVPLLTANLSPHSHIISNQSSVLGAQIHSHLPEKDSTLKLSPPINNTSSTIMTGDSSSQSGVINSDVGGGLKIVYEKQNPPSNSIHNLERVTPTPELPAKRSRSQSSEKPTRSKKRSSNNSGSNFNASTSSVPKRSSRSQSSIEVIASASCGSLTQNSIKESPPSSPSSESLGAPPANGTKKGRKSAPASVCGSSSSKDSKDNVKLFQNGVHAPHMLGNQLNPNSNMAQKMSDHLNSELEAHSIFNATETATSLVGPQLQHRVIASVRSSSTGGSSTASGGSGFSSMLGGSSAPLPQTLEQLLERHWEQGSQFLMEQAQHFDIASLLTCLHQLRAENLRLEEHVTALVQRRDHLLAINARLTMPLVNQSNSQAGHHHTVNNIHPHVSSTQGESSRQRHSSYSSQPVENGLPADQYSHQHRSPVTAPQPQPSPQSVRHSPAGNVGYSSSGLLRQNTADSTGRPNSSRSQQQYPMSYQSSSSQMMMRRDSDMHHQSSNKNS